MGIRSQVVKTLKPDIDHACGWSGPAICCGGAVDFRGCLLMQTRGFGSHLRDITEYVQHYAHWSTDTDKYARIHEW